MKRVFDFYSDAGHGWLKVEKKLLCDLGIADKITSYSYQRKDYAYLEEDCDASLFFNTYLEKNGCEIKTRQHYSDSSKIRSYEHYGLHYVCS